MFCPKCGREIDDKAVMCVWCGNQVKPLNEIKEDAPSKLYAALGFFFPIVGLILYLVENDKTPKKAKSAGKGAIAGFAVWCVVSFILTALYVVGMMSIVNSFVFESGGSEHTYDYSYNTDAGDNFYNDDGWYYDGEYTEFDDEGYYGDEFADVIIEGCFTGENGGVNILVANKTDYTADFVVTIEAVDGNGRTLAADSTAVVALIPGDVASAYMLGDFTEDLTADDMSDIEFRVVSVICEPRA